MATAGFEKSKGSVISIYIEEIEIVNLWAFYIVKCPHCGGKMDIWNWILGGL